MKQFCSKLTVMLVTISAAGLAQAPAPPATPTQPANPAATPAAGQRSQRRRRHGSAGRTPLPLRLPLRRRTPCPAPGSGRDPASGNTGGPIDPERYVIGAEDSLQITVWKEPTLSGTIPVRPDGMISLVLVGDLRAAGLTPMALIGDISQRLKKYIQDPVVTVVVLGVNSQRIFTVGEVNKVGPIMLTPGMTSSAGDRRCRRADRSLPIRSTSIFCEASTANRKRFRSTTSRR